MARLSKLFDILDLNGAPGCSKSLLSAIDQRGGRFEMSPESFRTGTDSKPLVELGLIEQNDLGRVDLTERAKKLI